MYAPLSMGLVSLLGCSRVGLAAGFFSFLALAAFFALGAVVALAAALAGDFAFLDAGFVSAASADGDEDESANALPLSTFESLLFSSAFMSSSASRFLLLAAGELLPLVAAVPFFGGMVTTGGRASWVKA